MSTSPSKLSLGNLPGFGNGKKERAYVENGLENFATKRD
jgi:hypothetical protein